MTKEKVLSFCKREGIEFIHLQFSDISGTVKSVTIPITQLKGAIENGKWFDGSSIEGFARIAESDMFLKPDLKTFAIIPWQEDHNKSARIICDVMTPNGGNFVGDPRAVLRTNLEDAKKKGFEFNVGPELEFFFFPKSESGEVLTVPTDAGGYFDFTADSASHVRMEIANAAVSFGIEVEASHHEVANGQHEIDFKYCDALTAADNVITLKYIIKAIAEKYNLHACFMPKPIYGTAGNGMHVHQSLSDGKNNLFFDKKDKYGLSKIVKRFIAGQLHAAPGICAVMSPLVNSYKRLVSGFEAPVYLTWARINRSALIRVPKFASKESARIELRSPDPSCNPYLAFSVMLAAGLNGIAEKLDPPKPVEENIYEMADKERKLRRIRTLPDSLGAAIREFGKSKVAQSALGEHVYERFVEARQLEWNEYKIQVTQWEHDNYLGKY
ncbi:type I glutamate--ammonia ligase [Candidatus Berkelbacteria bacterium CG10_big_fil_rev_8_21_14_0_10_41_12]|uniref:Glutamine synthetase n=1 Tax=Candidatus Berkelbacteria bacterium CG10_big_fil_rev_8_21_14_0_10_41_12 TaxID=1974513 RepID=A0A2M6WXW3_9BACT|nr:MAG: type I glutamate--ammonia ligase [Candidatus Berkelbacteria bacterium CG10_big_fil_rev_8_21_14_0_10_41_12]